MTLANEQTKTTCFGFDSSGLLSLKTMDLDAWIEKVKTATHLEENELKKLCEYVSYSHLA